MEPSLRRATEVAIADSRFDDTWLAEHQSDRALVEHMTARADRERSDDERRGEALQLESRRHHDVFDRLPRISCPTLVAAGRFDVTAPLENSMAIAAQIPQSELRVYEGGHPFLLQDRRALAEIMEFLAAG